MINFKNRAEILPSSIIVCSLLILLGTLLYMVLVPVPNAKGAAAGRTRSLQEVKDQIAAAKARTKEAQEAIAARAWEGSGDAVMATLLARLTQRAAQSHLQIAAFRPQKPQVVNGMSELPFSVQISGSYPTILRFLNTLDTPDNKMALRSLQIASSNGATSTVSVTAALSAYLADNGVAAGGIPSAATAKTATSTAAGGTRG